MDITTAFTLIAVAAITVLPATIWAIRCPKDSERYNCPTPRALISLFEKKPPVP